MSPEEAIKHIDVLTRDMPPDAKAELLRATIRNVRQLVERVEEARKAKAKAPA